MVYPCAYEDSVFLYKLLSVHIGKVGSVITHIYNINILDILRLSNIFYTLS